MIHQLSDDSKYWALSGDQDWEFQNRQALDYVRHDSNAVFQSQEYFDEQVQNPAQIILPEEPPRFLESSLFANRSKIFNIIRDELVAQPPKAAEVAPKLNIQNKTKLIQKREKAKHRKLMNELGDLESAPKSPKQSTISESLHEEPVSSKFVVRKMKKMVRNRIAAQNSRDRKKAYLDLLERENEDLKLVNTQLQEKIHQLEQWQKEHQQRFALPGEKSLEELTCLHCGKGQILQCGEEVGREYGNLEGTTSEDESHSILPSRNSYGLSRAGLFSLFSLISVLLLVGFYSVDSGIIKFDLTKGYHETRLMTQDDKLVKTLIVDPVKANSTDLANVMASCPTVDSSRWMRKIVDMQHEFEKKMSECQRQKEEAARRLNRRNSTNGKNKGLRAQPVAAANALVPKYNTVVVPTAIFLESRQYAARAAANQQKSRLQSPSQGYDLELPFQPGQEIQFLIPARNVTISSNDGNYLVPLPSSEKNGLMEILCQVRDFRTVFVD